MENLGGKITLKLGSLDGDFQLIDPKSMTKITGGKSYTTPPVFANTCGGIMPS